MLSILEVIAMLPFTRRGVGADELIRPEFFVLEWMSIGGTSPPLDVERQGDIEDEDELDEFYD